jgi:hypothetical protein
MNRKCNNLKCSENTVGTAKDGFYIYCGYSVPVSMSFIMESM